MSGGQIMVVLIVLIVMFASIIKSRHRPHRRHGGGASGEALAGDGEANRLREEVKQLKERLAVLERITIEKENSLEREIENLRDR